MALLTIAIPTYNRASFLDRCLQQICGQIEGCSDLLELIVSDNCSTDNTKEVVYRYQQAGMAIRYIRNAKNMGPCYNIAQCYKEAASKYVVVFGDDDIWLPGSIRAICDVLNEGEWGVVHLKALPINKAHDYNRRAITSLPWTVYTSPDRFLKKVHVFITFISGNIINKRFVERVRWDNFETSLIQVPLILTAIYGELKDVYIDKFVIGGQVDNSGGYNFFKVFGPNLYNILGEFKQAHSDFPIGIVSNEVLVGFFPHWIVKFRKNDLGKFENKSPYKELEIIYKNNFYFWTITYPLFFLPRVFLPIFYLFVRIFNKIRRRFAFWG